MNSRSSKAGHHAALRPVRLAVAILSIFACLGWGGAASAQTPPAAAAGTIVFVSGPVELVGSDGTRKRVEAGAAIRAGEQVATGADGYAHVRMVDNAFVAVRPQSRLAIETYDYDAANPTASRIKLQLYEGNARTVSGKGGEAAKRNYRFNTPMAAIGLRGTDYTVVANSEATRVSVSRGAVTVTPLSADCLASTLGPCATALTRELNAGIRHAYLEVSHTGPAPVLVRPEQDPQGGGGQNPPSRPNEPQSAAPSDLHLASAKEATTQVAADQIVAGLNSTVPPPPVPEFVWGRWSTFASSTPGSGSFLSVVNGNREIVVGNEVFALLREGSVPGSIPAQGAFSFQLAGSEAYTLNGGALTPAQVQGGTFGVDFSQRTFNTTLAVQHAAGVEQLAAQGTVQFQGLLIADPARSNMNLNGAVSGSGTQAAYLFDRTLATGSLLGAVRWVR
jgi:hypothetical protein